MASIGAYHMTFWKRTEVPHHANRHKRTRLTCYNSSPIDRLVVRSRPQHYWTGAVPLISILKKKRMKTMKRMGFRQQSGSEKRQAIWLNWIHQWEMNPQSAAQEVRFRKNHTTDKIGCSRKLGTTSRKLIVWQTENQVLEVLTAGQNELSGFVWSIKGFITKSRATWQKRPMKIIKHLQHSVNLRRNTNGSRNYY